MFDGKRGERRQRYREGQEGQLGAPGLEMNVFVLWNVISMDAALNRIRAKGFAVRAEDVARLSSLGFDHVNMLGRPAFTLPDTVARGELRPLRDPTVRDDEGGFENFRSRCYRPPISCRSAPESGDILPTAARSSNWSTIGVPWQAPGGAPTSPSTGSPARAGTAGPSTDALTFDSLVKAIPLLPVLSTTPGPEKSGAAHD